MKIRFGKLGLSLLIVFGVILSVFNVISVARASDPIVTWGTTTFVPWDEFLRSPWIWMYHLEGDYFCINTPSNCNIIIEP